jgi:hypothetical protein
VAAQSLGEMVGPGDVGQVSRHVTTIPRLARDRQSMST